MSRKFQNKVSLIDYQAKYATNEACESELYKLKWPRGFKCPYCGCNEYYMIKSRRLPLYQCKECKHQTTVIKDTIMENTKLSLVKWFLALYFIATNKNGISESALANYIGVAENTAWLLLHKVRKSMGTRDALYKLGTNVEMDEAFFGGKKNGKRGRGSKKTKVVVSLETVDNKYPTFLKMSVIPDCKGQTLQDFATANMKEGTVINSDSFKSYYKLKENFEVHMEKYVPSEENNYLKWLHVMISNIKSNIAGTYHGLDGKYLQNYLDEFCYRFNRRNSHKPVLTHLLECCVWADYHKASELCA